MQIKTIEIRDRATFIPAMAIRLGSEQSERDRYLLARAGFGRYHDNHLEYVILVRLNEQRCAWDPYEWADRTMQTAHAHILNNWESLETGAVVDVQFINGETAAPKRSEQETVGGA